ncbi:hypothetical protein ISF_02455 [Cordyceps fumosorosea ARSEF 2679]|uniref:Uncharacterized protein n=1 Tax=Cordyceps fumosorosea (strain ARSEF 2679) TaxID=1081104 RepID=A0A168BS87_CORFA|nr:hypothetical protein ISF_02455 [Cordyceps fumosorosea ARSEF 2679]OAA70481.1 hypothetical protein ISF_02455 [Cordyceps fumosorosea ARSEF 2679]
MASETTQPVQQSESGPASQELPTEAYPVSDNRDPAPLVPPPPPPPAGGGGGGMPTVDDPFNFPTDEALPAYSAYASDAVAAAPPPTFADGAGPSSSGSSSAAAGAPPSYHPSGNARPDVMISTSSTTNTSFSFSMGGRAKPSRNSKLGPPPKTGLAASTMKPVAIPQVVPDASSPFVGAYPPCLLARGITEATWRSFLDTVSAFLTATVGDRAVSHAGDMARHLTADTTDLGKNLAGQSKRLGKDLARHARRGNILGVAATLVGGAISLPMTAAFGTVGTVTRLPGAMVGAVAKRPRTPAERVNAYTVVANGEWLNRRGLHAQLVDTAGLAHVLDVPPGQLLAVARGGKEGSAEGMLRALDAHVEPLKVEAGATLGLSEKTLWLVLVEVDPAAVAAEQEKARRGDADRDFNQANDSVSERIRQAQGSVDERIKQANDGFDQKLKQANDRFDQKFKQVNDGFKQKFSQANHDFGRRSVQGGGASSQSDSAYSQHSNASSQRKGVFGLHYNSFSHSNTTATYNNASGQAFGQGSGNDNNSLGKDNDGSGKANDGSSKDINSSSKGNDSPGKGKGSC